MAAASAEVDLADLLRKLILYRELVANLEEDAHDERVIGLRVVRGLSWTWEDQDKGEGFVGTVVKIQDKNGVVIVVWDHGTAANYSAGYQDRCDLAIFDNSAVGVRHSHSCDACGEREIRGMRWHCTNCNNYDLCTSCYMGDKHDTQHPFVRFTTPESDSVAVGVRNGAKKVKAAGVFPGAVVKRGRDWKWQEQDSNGSGLVTKVDGWDNDTERSSAAVLWENGHSSAYRMGFKGKVDLQYEKPATGDSYYPAHLPALNINYVSSTTETDGVPASRPPRAEANVRAHQGEPPQGALAAEENKYVGARVIRGQDWEWNDQDGGEFNVGTVEGKHRSLKGVVGVTWDNGKGRYNYRTGHEGKFDLRVVDSGPSGVLHQRVRSDSYTNCDGCGDKPLHGIRWKCQDCANYDLCSVCYGDNVHDLEHKFWRIDLPLGERVSVPSRSSSQRQQLTGIFKGATVQRGIDWRWENQDGGEGSKGVVQEIVTVLAKSGAGRSWARVRWPKGTEKHYRVGHNGFIDLKAVTPANGWFVYPDHLAHLKMMESCSSAPKNFKEIKEIGRGAFGSVHLCLNEETGANFALKRISVAAIGGKADVRQTILSFMQEIQLYTKLKHVRIVQYLGCSQSGDRIEIFLEYASGGCLRDILPVKEALTRRFTKQILEGLDYLHKHNVIHRDIKGLNILRDVSGNIKIVDFGISKYVDELTSVQQQSFVGTPHWMAPEIMLEEPYNSRIDIWSLGCTIVEMLTEIPPNFDTTPAKLVKRFMEKKLEYKLPSHVSRDLKEFLQTLLDWEPTSRLSAEQALDHPYMRGCTA